MSKIAPFIRKGAGVPVIMLDVIISLIPLLTISILAFGLQAVYIIVTALITALLTEYVFSLLFKRATSSVFDGSSIISAFLLSLTLSPYTPLYVVAFGAFCAVAFGKVLLGGLGRNRLNPALIGRETMVIFFPAIMTASFIWPRAEDALFQVDPAYDWLYSPSGAMGEYSIAALIIGGLYLLWRKRISWHIPLALIGIFYLFYYVNNDATFYFSVGGLLLGAIFMATDMPSSPLTPSGKFFYGLAIGISAFFFIKLGVRFEYMSYAILMLNCFVNPINQVFARHRALNIPFAKDVAALLAKLIITFLALIQIHELGLVYVLVYIYIVFAVVTFHQSYNTQRKNSGELHAN